MLKISAGAFDTCACRTGKRRGRYVHRAQLVLFNWAVTCAHPVDSRHILFKCNKFNFNKEMQYEY